MPVVVRNELAEPWVFEGSRGSRQIAAGATAVISDEEWATVISAKRGPGGLHAISNDPGSQTKTAFDYALVNGTYETVYLGEAAQSAADTDSVWTIKFFQYGSFGGSNQITEIQILDGVAWADRATLPWS